ncbi:MAG: hypothetical protein V9G04_04280 [Nocardioides sp.]|jgi:hypothetical protein
MHLKRATGLIGATAALTLVAGAVPAQAAQTPEEYAAGWLAKQVTDGVVHNAEFDFDDWGLTVDVAFALLDNEGKSDTTKAINKGLKKNIRTYVTGAPSGSTDVYAGAAAKAGVFADVVGANPQKYGGLNLVKTVEGQVSTDSLTRGRLQDTSEYGDYANVLGQAYAVRLLAVEGSSKTRAATRFLLKQQCKSGFFRLNFSAADADQTCDGSTGDAKAPDTDATAIAALQLAALPKQSKAVKTAIKKAGKWLVKTQRKNGGFGGGVATSKPNSNSTGLAASALILTGNCRPAAKAARFLLKLQPETVKGTELKGQRGAIAYDKAGLKAGLADGITDSTRDQWIRSTAQAINGLSGCV